MGVCGPWGNSLQKSSRMKPSTHHKILARFSGLTGSSRDEIKKGTLLKPLGRAWGVHVSVNLTVRCSLFAGVFPSRWLVFMEEPVHVTAEALSRADSFAAAWGFTCFQGILVVFQAGLDVADRVWVGAPWTTPSTAVGPTVSSGDGYLCPQCGSNRMEKRGTDYWCLDCSDSKSIGGD